MRRSGEMAGAESELTSDRFIFANLENWESHDHDFQMTDLDLHRPCCAPSENENNRDNKCESP